MSKSYTPSIEERLECLRSTAAVLDRLTHHEIAAEHDWSEEFERQFWTKVNAEIREVHDGLEAIHAALAADARAALELAAPDVLLGGGAR